MDRKYKQRGYQDGASGGDDGPKPPVPRKDREGPRSPNMMAFQGAMRCGMCGEPVQLELTGVDVELERPSEAQHGEYATNVALRLAGVRRQPPREVAATRQVPGSRDIDGST